VTERRPLDEDPLVDAFLRGAPPGSPGATGGCPPAIVLARVAEGALRVEERDGVEGHLISCSACRGVVVALAKEGASAERVTRRHVLPLAIAASLLVAALGVWGAMRPAKAPTEEALRESAAGLVAARPDLFAGFRPLDRAELLAAESPARRGAGGPVYPAETILETRPTFRWDRASGITRWSVTLRTSEGNALWSRDAGAVTTLAYPADAEPLVAGALYLGELTGHGPLGETSSRRAFRVAPTSDARAYSEASREIDARVPANLRALVRAHVAIRKGLLGEAERALREALASRAGDPLVRETAHHVLRRLGSSDAARYAPRPAESR
jgi:hypothetical protein